MSDESQGREPLLLYLTDGREIRLGVDPKEWADAFHNALAKNEAIQIDDPSGQGTYGVNPRAILYWKSEPGSSLDRPER